MCDPWLTPAQIAVGPISADQRRSIDAELTRLIAQRRYQQHRSRLWHPPNELETVSKRQPTVAQRAFYLRGPSKPPKVKRQMTPAQVIALAKCHEANRARAAKEHYNVARKAQDTVSDWVAEMDSGRQAAQHQATASPDLAGSLA